MLSLDTVWATIKIILPILSLVNIISSLTVCLSTRLSAAQGTQCKFSHFLASVGACNLILHIHVLVNWHLSKQGICWPVSHDYIVVSGANPLRLHVFWKLSADSYRFSTDHRLNPKWISLWWLQVYCLKQIIIY